VTELKTKGKVKKRIRESFDIKKYDLIRCDFRSNDNYDCFLEKKTRLRERLRSDYNLTKYRKDPEYIGTIDFYKSDEMFGPMLFDGKMRFYPSYNKGINVIAYKSGKCEILPQPDRDAKRLICKF